MPNPADQHGALLRYGQRWTYFPPHVKQAASQCTMTAALMGANVAFAGTIDATTQEAVRLGRETGIDSPPPGGYTTDHMVFALKKRYGLDLEIEFLGLESWRRRLTNRAALIVAVDYQSLPLEHRQLAPDFDGGHRMLAVGYDEEKDTTSLIDPLASGPQDRGIDIKLRALYRAMGDGFKFRQVWVREGQMVKVAADFEGSWDPPRVLTLAGDGATKYRFWDRRRPGVPAIITPKEDIEVEFDAKATLTPSIKGLMPTGGPFLRISGGDRGRIVGLWLEVTDGINPNLDGEKDIPVSHKASFKRGIAAGRAQEHERWTDWLASGPFDAGVLDTSDAPPEPMVGSGLEPDA